MEKSKISKIPSNRRQIHSKFIFKNKIDGQYRASLFVQGHLKIPGVYFIESRLKYYKYADLLLT